jgi:putative transposase
MTPCHQRHTLVALIEQACSSGARLHKACALTGLHVRTLQLWRGPKGHDGDLRVREKRQAIIPPNKLSEEKRRDAQALLNSEAFKNLPPSQVVPRLADQGRYVASESILYRLLREAGQMTHRHLERVAHKRHKPRALVASGPDQVYCWDISYLPTEVRGIHYYQYLFVDLFSRRIVGWQVCDSESAQQASQLLQDICQRQGVAPNQLTVHSDNGLPIQVGVVRPTPRNL